MNSTKINLFYGSLLHDIGKLIQRATGQREKHAILGADWLETYHPNKEVSQQIRYHMSNYQSSQLPSDSLAYITNIADNIASGIDRRSRIEVYEDQNDTGVLFDTYTNQQDIFNTFLEATNLRYYQPLALNTKDKPNFPTNNNLRFSQGEYAGLLKRFEQEVTRLKLEEEYMDSFLNLNEAVLSFVPASTYTKEMADISLAEHAKMTTAIAMSIYDYLNSKEITDFKSYLYNRSSAFYDEQAFLLCSYDISGIQDFIYSIVTSGAAKQLKARSLYLDFISEYVADSLLDKLQLTRANLLYSGGGHGYLLLPNTDKTHSILENFEKEYNRFLLDHFQGQLFVAFGWTPFSASEIKVEESTLKAYQSIYGKVSQIIANKKLTRYDAEQLIRLNSRQESSKKECLICHRQMNFSIEDENCHICQKLSNFAKNIDNPYFMVNRRSSGLPIGPDAYLHPTHKDQLIKHEILKIYVKNSFEAGELPASHLFMGDYRYANIHDYAELAQADGEGIKRMGVLRLDVDDLGAAFMAGFSHQAGGRYNTLTRSAVFSKMMSLFFKVYINNIAEGKKISIIYSGGDDVFAIGAWQDTLDFVVNLRESFVNWTNRKLTVSAGMGIFSEKTPVRNMANYTGQLESFAKDFGRDAICLFDQRYTMKFDQFIENVYRGKFVFVKDFFDFQQKVGKAFIYKLLDLIRDFDLINLPRIAYTFASMEANLKRDKEVQESFSIFKDKAYHWIVQGQESRLELELALILYIYMSRKEHP